MALNYLDEMGDLILGVHADYGKKRIQNLMLDLTHYEAMGQIIRGARSEGGSHTFRRNLALQPGQSGRWVGITDQDLTIRVDGASYLEVPWRYFVNSRSYEYTEMLTNMNAGENKVFDVIKFGIDQQDANTAEEMEIAMWSNLANTTSKEMWGIPHWFPKPTAGQDGFNGQNPSGFSTMAGVDTSLEANKRFRSYVRDYDAVDENFVIALERCARRTNFRSPVSMTEYTKGNGKRFSFYINETVQEGLNKMLRNRNDNLGTNLGNYGDGTAHLNRNPFIYIPYLDADTSHPVYGINWNVFEFYTMKGNKFRQTKKVGEPNHNWVSVFEDIGLNSCCFDRRRCFVMAQV